MGLDTVGHDLPFAVAFAAIVVKVLIIFVIALQIPPVMVWLERRIPALMQRRRGPNRVGLFKWRLWGLLQSLADAVKLIFKEESVPEGANRYFYHLAPVLSVFPVFLVLCAIPFGEYIQIVGYQIPLTIINLNVGFLFIIAMAGMAIYGVTLAGWSSNNTYSLLGSLRASAQMISYEIPLGLSLIPLVLIYDSLNLTEIVRGQANVWTWGVLLSPVSFFIFLICMFAETNRTPFDLAEAESELIVGYHTEFGSAKFAAFFFAEYVSMFALSCLCAVLFFGGWHIPFVSQETLLSIFGNINIVSLIGILVLFMKAGFFMFLYIWVRWTIPRFRYDQLMNLGWKFLIPLGLVNILVTAMVLTGRF